MVHRASASHVGTCFSMAELLSVLYCSTMRIDSKRPTEPERDRFILSKGHGAAIVYAALAERGFFPISTLDTYCQVGSPLTGHINHKVPGVEASTGSLGHGLPIACGMALAGRDHYRVYALLSDGELDEGSNWEAILFAPFHHLSNLVAIVDYNKIQSFGRVSDVLELEPLRAKFEAFGWAVREIDGHDITQIQQTLDAAPFVANKPSAIIAHTIKGKGVSFMENALAWHYKSPTSDELARALTELNAAE